MKLIINFSGKITFYNKNLLRTCRKKSEESKLELY